MGSISYEKIDTSDFVVANYMLAVYGVLLPDICILVVGLLLLLLLSK